jgi:hypothetical protein
LRTSVQKFRRVKALLRCGKGAAAKACSLFNYFYGMAKARALIRTCLFSFAPGRCERKILHPYSAADLPIHAKNGVNGTLTARPR